MNEVVSDVRFDVPVHAIAGNSNRPKYLALTWLIGVVGRAKE